MKQLNWLSIFFLAVSIINYPNPVNIKGGQAVSFECTVDSTLEAAIYVYDLSARLLLQKTFSLQGGKTNKSNWDGYTRDNEIVGNGVYLYRLVDPANKRSLAKGKIWVINH